MAAAIRRLFNEPRPGDVPGRHRWDWLLAFGFCVAVAIELALREATPWKPLLIAVWSPFAFTLLLRRTRPLLALTMLMVPLTIFDILLARLDQPLPDVYSSAFALILVYSVFRWGSGTEMKWAAAILTTAVLVDAAAGFASIGDMIGGFVILAATAEAGIVVRRQRGVVEATRADARSREREQLARELHDTVAHHISAIAVQAQAGRAVLATDPERATSTFDAIEESAARALAEMRVVVDVLRSDAPWDPSRGVDDLDRLGVGMSPPLRIERRGDLDGLQPQVEAAIYRIAQESVTNAHKHSDYATEVVVELDGGSDHIHLTISNDGAPVAFRPDIVTGHGLVGMEERVELLGGTFTSGPRRGGGWMVEVRLPRDARRVSRAADASSAVDA